MKLVTLVIAFLAVVTSPLTMARQLEPEVQAIKFPLPPNRYTHVVSPGGGDWHNPATWVGNSVPTTGAIVHIPANRQVVIRTQIPDDIRFVRVEGTLRFSIHQNTSLRVETLYVAHSGLLALGTPTFRMRVDRTCDIIFVKSATTPFVGWDPNELSLGLVAHGAVKMYGQNRTHWAELAGSATVGQMSLTLDGPVPSDWARNDELIVAGTRFDRDRNNFTNESELHDEKVTINDIPSMNGMLGPNEIDLTSALTEDHLALGLAGPNADRFRIHVAHVTRNIVFRSLVSTSIDQRGHIMLMNPDVELVGVAFEGLGRTDKTIPLDEITFSEDSTGRNVQVDPNPSPQNRRGRYALHFHQNNLIFPNDFDPAQAPPTLVHNCVVNDAVGWGFVNHSSHVDFSNCVAYDFAGAGFVTESGDELGTFYNNIAIHGTGTLNKYFLIRTVFRSYHDCPTAQRPQYLGDFGFGGDGFWFQGPMIRAVNNVASSCNGAGMFWFTTGAVDIGDGVGPKPYVGVKGDVWRTVYGNAGFNTSQMRPKFWWGNNNPQSFPPEPERNYVLGELPILENEDFTAYGCFVGHRLRFVNADHTAAFYNDHIDVYGNNMRQVDGGSAAYVPQEVSNITCWNNYQGIRSRYTLNTTWKDVLVDNVHSYNSLYPALSDDAYSGGELFHINENLTIEDSDVRGYSVGFWINTNDPPATVFPTTLTNVTVEGAASDFVDDLTTGGNVASPMAMGLALTQPAGASTAQIQWTANSGIDRIAVRYRLRSSTVWERTTVNSPLTSTTLTGLVPGSDYECQIIAGNGNDVSEWTDTLDFSTQ